MKPPGDTSSFGTSCFLLPAPCKPQVQGFEQACNALRQWQTDEALNHEVAPKTNGLALFQTHIQISLQKLHCRCAGVQDVHWDHVCGICASVHWAAELALEFCRHSSLIQSHPQIQELRDVDPIRQHLVTLPVL